ncbi:dual specificity protein phosphatase family protein [Bacillus sp. 31A1R]|uniref:Dual specificity protein phosphatase family protein n=1 Tax=Robertmurraya mangrovi TaxID=3098077 RepID=A0ABU5IYS4_9BACI|nr:dual specificity protein phosphatase family protein [Bacillus sp. 31A1R]MDZ5472324.1 dual specificity protein phosphatase family protein [Bacillus sp. 31A1R]
MSEKNYQALIKDRIFIGGADDVDEVMRNETVDVIYDLRAEAPTQESKYNRIHNPIVDDEEFQEKSVKKAIDEVMKSYNEGKKIYFHCGGGSNRTGTVAIGTLLALGEAETINDAEEMSSAVRPKIKVKPEMKEALKKIYPDA